MTKRTEAALRKVLLDEYKWLHLMVVDLIKRVKEVEKEK